MSGLGLCALSGITGGIVGGMIGIRWLFTLSAMARLTITSGLLAFTLYGKPGV